MTTVDFKFKEFCNLDDSPDADYLIRSMDVMLTLESIQKIKHESVGLLNLNPGDIVLEAGCGCANDVLIMADKINDDGQVIAIDNSKRMLNEAYNRIKHKNITFQLMNVEHIQYPDNHFSAAHADRLLVSHTNYSEIFKEISRVTKSGGTIAITDVDAQTLALSPTNPTSNIVIRKILESFVNADMGRKLLNIFSDNNYGDIKIMPNLCTITDFSTLEKIFDFNKILESCIKDDLLSKGGTNIWIKDMNYFSQKKQFLYCIVFFTVCGKKP